MPDAVQIERIQRYVPSEILPSGFKQLAIVALEHPTDYAEYLNECYRLFDVYIDEMSTCGKSTDANYFWGLLSGQDETELIDVGLLDFYTQFIFRVNALLGRPEYRLSRILSLRVNNAVCVELKWPHAQAMHCE